MHLKLKTLYSNLCACNVKVKVELLDVSEKYYKQNERKMQRQSLSKMSHLPSVNSVMLNVILCTMNTVKRFDVIKFKKQLLSLKQTKSCKPSKFAYKNTLISGFVLKSCEKDGLCYEHIDLNMIPSSIVKLQSDRIWGLAT